MMRRLPIVLALGVAMLGCRGGGGGTATVRPNGVTAQDLGGRWVGTYSAPTGDGVLTLDITPSSAEWCRCWWQFGSAWTPDVPTRVWPDGRVQADLGPTTQMILGQLDAAGETMSGTVDSGAWFRGTWTARRAPAAPIIILTERSYPGLDLIMIQTMQPPIPRSENLSTTPR